MLINLQVVLQEYFNAMEKQKKESFNMEIVQSGKYKVEFQPTSGLDYLVEFGLPLFINTDFVSEVYVDQYSKERIVIYINGAKLQIDDREHKLIKIFDKIAKKDMEKIQWLYG